MTVAVQTTLTGTELQRTLNDLRREKKCLQQQLARRNRRVSNMSEMLELLEKNHLADDAVSSIFSSHLKSSLPFELFENELHNLDNSPTNRRYSQEMKQFCLTLHFYSPRAYEFIRSRSTLPDPSTLRRWLATRKCDPGILHEVLEFFKKKIKSSADAGYLKDVALVYDAMAIRAGRWYDKKNDKHCGYVDLGGISNVDSEEYATETLLFIIVSFTKIFKCPVAYFLINKINATLQSELVLAVVDALYDSGITVRSLTSDGTSTNLRTYEKLGCILSPENLQPFFSHPRNSDVRIHCIMDPCHMIKLCRNCLGEVQLSSNTGAISFDYVKKIHEIQNQENLKFANKLTTMHVFYKNKKMNVRLAAQVISSSVADTMQFLQMHDSYFDGATATIEFIRIFDRLFDIMNSRSRFGTGYKSPMSPQNRPFWEAVFDESRTYILQLKCEGKPLIDHRRKTFALGFFLNTVSMQGLALDLFSKENPLDYYLPYKTSQDHAELTFSCIRSAGGHNNNPHCLAVKWTLRKLLFRNSVTASNNANCKEKKLAEKNNCDDTEEVDDGFSFGIFSPVTIQSREENDLEDVESGHQTNQVLAENIQLSSYQSNILYYIAGSITRAYLQKYPCKFCEQIMTTNRLEHSYNKIPITDCISFTALKSRGGLKFVSVFVMEIISFTEKVHKATVLRQIRKNNLKGDTMLAVQKKFTPKIKELGHPLVDTDFKELHEIRIIKFISSAYLNLRIDTQCKKATSDYLGMKGSIRQKLHNLILFNNV